MSPDPLHSNGTIWHRDPYMAAQQRDCDHAWIDGVVKDVGFDPRTGAPTLLAVHRKVCLKCDLCTNKPINNFGRYERDYARNDVQHLNFETFGRFERREIP